MSEQHPPLDMRDNPAESRYEAAIDGDVAVAEYILQGNEIVFTHTEVPEAFEGRGIASQLARFALDDARARGLAVIPSCPFIANYIQHHAEYQPLVAGGDNRDDA
jgi:predicted GNAT family acetyltransferase